MEQYLVITVALFAHDGGAYLAEPDAMTPACAAEAWIRQSPDAFCNTQDATILSQVLNDYDQETKDFYRWRLSYSQQELKTLIANRLKMDSISS